MTFDARSEPHEAHLRDVAKALKGRGFSVERTGREAQTPPSRVGELGRWWPDLLARRGPYGRLYVDAKNDQSPETENYAVELAALACYGLIVARYRIEVVLVWPGGKCNYAMDLRPHSVQTRAINGSGTAYLLVRERDQKGFDDIFVR